MRNQHIKVLVEIKQRGKVTIENSDFVNWFEKNAYRPSASFLVRSDPKKRLSGVLSSMFSLGYLSQVKVDFKDGEKESWRWQYSVK